MQQALVMEIELQMKTAWKTEQVALNIHSPRLVQAGKRNGYYAIDTQTAELLLEYFAIWKQTVNFEDVLRW